MQGAAEERLSVVATWQHPGTESPFWLIDTTVPSYRMAAEAVATATESERTRGRPAGVLDALAKR